MYRAVVEKSISAHRGHIFSSAGDGVVAEFPSIVEAIRCAVEIQNEIAERNAAVPEDDRMQFRIGVNLGDVIVEDNNLYGTGVNVAVRLEQLAEPGGICISQTVYEQVRKIVENPIPGYRRAPFEEHCRSDTGLSHPSLAIAVAQQVSLAHMA